MDRLLQDSPAYEDAKEIAETLIEAFKDGGRRRRDPHRLTEFVSMLTQNVVVKRILPLEVEETEATETDDDPCRTSSSSRPRPTCSTSLLPRYVERRIFTRCCSRRPPSRPRAAGR